MRRLLKIYLLLSSIFVFSGCSISKYNHHNCDKIVLNETFIEPVIKAGSVLKYNTSIDVLKNHLTGLLIVKQTDSITKHLVFVTELGMKMFDFEVKNNLINTAYIFEPLNKPKMVDALKRNFSYMFMLSGFGNNDCKYQTTNEIIYTSKRGKSKHCFIVSKTAGLTTQETFHKRKKTSKITYLYNSATQTYSQIKCKQYGLIKFYFELNEPQLAP